MSDPKRLEQDWQTLEYLRSQPGYYSKPQNQQEQEDDLNMDEMYLSDEEEKDFFGEEEFD